MQSRKSRAGCNAPCIVGDTGGQGEVPAFAVGHSKQRRRFLGTATAPVQSLSPWTESR
jgi:hypothetical protein